MSHLDDNNDELTRELRNRSEDVGGHPIDFDSVRRTARGIQRRRRIAGGVAAAAVLAVVVPAGMAASNSLNLGQQPAGQPTTTVPVTSPYVPTTEPSGGDEPTPTEVPTASEEPTASPPQPTQTASEPTTKVTTPSDSPTASPSPDPNAGKTVELTAADAVRGAEPAIAYIDGPTLHVPDAPPLNLGASYYDIAPHKGGWVALGSDDDGNRRLFFLAADGTVQDSAATTGESLAINYAGDYVAYALTNGVIELAPTEDAGETWTFRRLETQGPITPVAVGPVQPVNAKYAEPICAFFYNIEGEPRAGYANCHGIVDRYPLRRVTGIAPDYSFAGIKSVSDTGSTCSQVRDDDWSIRWETCDYALGHFSPDSRHVLARSPYGDEGGGDVQVTILDAQTGAVVVSYQTARNSESFVADVAWEDDSHVLATVQEDGVWRILRLDLDGNIEAATGEMRNHEAPRFSATP